MEMILKITPDSSVEEFALYFLKSRLAWNNIPRVDNIKNFGTIISLTLYRQPPFQVELFIAPEANSIITTHRHPDVDAVEYGLCGDNTLIINDKPVYTSDQMNTWLLTDCDTPFVRIKPSDWHSGFNITSASFLSIQKWLNNVTPSSVGLNWEGEVVSNEHESLLKSLEDEAMWHMTL
jgi:hypothetical protein